MFVKTEMTLPFIDGNAVARGSEELYGRINPVGSVD